MRRGDQPWLAQPKLVKLGSGLFGESLRLVDRQHDRAARDAQPLGDAGILARQAFARVEDENDNVALGDRLLGLRRHLAHNAFGIDGLEAAGVNDDVVTRPNAALAVVAVTREPRKIGDQRRARARQSIEQR